MTKIIARIVLEILGRPPEHVSEALNTVVVKMIAEDGVDIIEKKYHEPKKVEKTKDLYTAFAEVEVEFESVERYFAIILAYLPSHIEIVSPSGLKMKNSDLNIIGNGLIKRLHDYDAIAKRLVAERDILMNRLNQTEKEKSSKKKK